MWLSGLPGHRFCLWFPTIVLRRFVKDDRLAVVIQPNPNPNQIVLVAAALGRQHLNPSRAVLLYQYLLTQFEKQNHPLSLLLLLYRLHLNLNPCHNLKLWFLSLEKHDRNPIRLENSAIVHRLVGGLKPNALSRLNLLLKLKPLNLQLPAQRFSGINVGGLHRWCMGRVY